MWPAPRAKALLVADPVDAISLAGGFRDDARTARIRLVWDGEVVELDASRTLEHGGDAERRALQGQCSSHRNA
jgi:hypothetical protein